MIFLLSRRKPAAGRRFTSFLLSRKPAGFLPRATRPGPARRECSYGAALGALRANTPRNQSTWISVETRNVGDSLRGGPGARSPWGESPQAFDFQIKLVDLLPAAGFRLPNQTRYATECRRLSTT